MLLNAGIVAASAESGSAWTPADITTALWLDASDSATLFDSTTGGSLPVANGEIARWDDKSGNNRHATQATSRNRPLRRVAFVNSRDVADYDGSNDVMTHPVIVTSPSALTIAAIVKGVGLEGQVIWSHRSEATRVIQIALLDGDAYYAIRGSGNVAIELAYPVDVAQWNIIVATLNVAGNSHKLRVNGAQRATSTYDFGSETFNSTINSVGAQSTGGAFVNSLNGEMGQLIVASTVLSDPDIERLEGYFAHHLGQTAVLDAAHPYKTVAP